MEGDSVTLHTDLTDIHEDDYILWKYGAQEHIIAEILKKYELFYTHDNVTDGRFRDRLKLDHQTGSLTITNTTTEHTGVYKLVIRRVNLTSKTFSVSVYGEMMNSCCASCFIIHLHAFTYLNICNSLRGQT